MDPYYSDGQVALYHGDCLEIEAWLEADVLVTDPPYGRAWRQGDLGPLHTRNAASLDGIAGDQDTTARDEVLNRWGNRPALVFGDLTLPPPAGLKLTAIYQKDNTCGLRGAIGGIRRDAEAIYLLNKGWGSGIGGRSSVFSTAARVSSSAGVVARHGGHPHTKPGDVMEQLIALSPPGVIADPFAGSGSTLVAARNLGRKAIGVELEERYCELVAKRLDQMCLDFGEGA